MKKVGAVGECWQLGGKVRPPRKWSRGRHTAEPVPRLSTTFLGHGFGLGMTPYSVRMFGVRAFCFYHWEAYSSYSSIIQREKTWEFERKWMHWNVEAEARRRRTRLARRFDAGVIPGRWLIRENQFGRARYVQLQAPCSC